MQSQSLGILQFRGWADKERLEKKTTVRSVSLGHSSGDAVCLVSGAEQGRHLCRVISVGTSLVVRGSEPELLRMALEGSPALGVLKEGWSRVNEEEVLFRDSLAQDFGTQAK